MVEDKKKDKVKAKSTPKPKLKLSAKPKVKPASAKPEAKPASAKPKAKLASTKPKTRETKEAAKTPSKKEVKTPKPTVEPEKKPGDKPVKKGKLETVEEPKKEEATVEAPAEEKTEEEKKKKKIKEKKPKPIEKIKNLPEKTEEAGKTKPAFVRQELSIRKRVHDKWRRPRGIDSKQIEGKRGKGAMPSIGYGSPKQTLGRHPSGLNPLRVNNVKELSALTKGQGAVIAAQVGRRKRNLIIKEANKLKITILNPRKGEI